MSVIYFSLFNIRSGTLHFTNRINMNRTSSHKLADNQHKIWVTVLNQKNHASMKEIITVYTIESISVLQKLSCIYLYSVHYKVKQNNHNKKEGMLRKAKQYWALPYTGRVALVLEIQKGVCLTHHKIEADRNSALFFFFDQQTIVCQQINT